MSKQRRERGLFGQPISEASDQEIVRIVKLALRLAKRHLADYSHPKSPRKFTQPQLFACVILKGHLGCVYRKLEELLILMPEVREAIGLKAVPCFTTLQTFADRPDILGLIDGVLASIGRAINQACPQDAAIDGTGMETTSAPGGGSLCQPRGADPRKRTKFVKLTLAVLCTSMIPVALVVDWAPGGPATTCVRPGRCATSSRPRRVPGGRPGCGATARSTAKRGIDPTGRTGACPVTPRPRSGAAMGTSTGFTAPRS